MHASTGVAETSSMAARNSVTSALRTSYWASAKEAMALNLLCTTAKKAWNCSSMLGTTRSLEYSLSCAASHTTHAHAAAQSA